MALNDSAYGHAFNLLPDIGALRLEKLFLGFDSFEAAWNASSKEIEEKTSDRFLAKILDNREKVNPAKEWEKINRLNIKIITARDPLYPPLLHETAHPPSLLYIKGGAETLQSQEKAAAVVGTRRPTPYGREAARAISRELAEKKIIIVSGLAFGIDSEAHRAAIEAGGATWAVIGSGLEKIYPRTNIPLAESIIEKGGLIISEYHPFEKAAPWTFPQRNRIIAGLSHATIVVEAPLKSGALITSRFALDSNREVGAVPGEIFSENSKGANKLISMGAKVIRSADDVLEMLGIETIQDQLPLDIFDEIEQRIIQCLNEPADTETILAITETSPEILNRKLSLLEIRGIIKYEAGKFYKIQ